MNEPGRLVIWKFTLNPSGLVSMPLRSRPISVGAQGEDLVVWATTDPDEVSWCERRLTVVATGEEIPAGTFIGTAQMDNGLVFHVFDGGEA